MSPASTTLSTSCHDGIAMKFMPCFSTSSELYWKQKVGLILKAMCIIAKEFIHTSLAQSHPSPPLFHWCNCTEKVHSVFSKGGGKWQDSERKGALSLLPHNGFAQTLICYVLLQMCFGNWEYWYDFLNAIVINFPQGIKNYLETWN